MAPPNKDWWKLAVVAAIAVVLAGLGTVIASNMAPSSASAGPVIALSSTTTTTPGTSTTRQLVVVDSAAATSSTTLPVSPAAIEVSDTIVEFGDVGTDVSIELTNTGGEVASWVIQSSDASVAVNPSEGEIGAGEVLEVAVTLDRSVAPEGELDTVLVLTWGDQELQLFVQGTHSDNPVIIAPKATPDTVQAQTGEGCSPAKATITAKVKDTSELASVIVRWSDGVSTIETTMSAVDEENFKAVIGPFSKVAEPNAKIVAKDVHDNAGGAPVALTVSACL